MGELITTMFQGVSDTAKGLGTALKEMFLNILYADPTASELVLSDFAKFSFLFMGVSLAFGIGYFIIRKITSLS